MGLPSDCKLQTYKQYISKQARKANLSHYTTFDIMRVAVQAPCILVIPSE